MSPTPRLVLALVALASLALRAPAADLRTERFFAQSLGREVVAAVHLPPSYDQTDGRYPVIYALHGLFEDASFWQRRGLAELTEAAWAGGLPEVVIASVDGGNSFFVNGPAGSYQDLLTRDLVAHVESRYRVRSGRGGRALLGVSMGGYAALRIAFQEPTRFAAVATHSAMLLQEPPTSEAGAGRGQLAALQRAFGDPIDTALWQASDPLQLARSLTPGALPALYIDCGAEDRYRLYEGHRALHALLEQRGVAHEFALPPGDHGYAFVRARLRDSLEFLTRQLGAGTDPGNRERSKP